jgi:hypothetical protein
MSWVEYTSYQNYPSGNIKQLQWECKTNETIRKNDKLNTSWGYRDYLQKNTNTIINHNTNNALLNGNMNIINRGYSQNTLYPSDLKQSFLNEKKNIYCPSILM